MILPLTGPPPVLLPLFSSEPSLFDIETIGSTTTMNSPLSTAFEPLSVEVQSTPIGVLKLQCLTNSGPASKIRPVTNLKMSKNDQTQVVGPKYVNEL